MYVSSVSTCSRERDNDQNNVDSRAARSRSWKERDFIERSKILAEYRSKKSFC